MEPADDREEHGLHPTACGSRGSWNILDLIRGGGIFESGVSSAQQEPQTGSVPESWPSGTPLTVYVIQESNLMLLTEIPPKGGCINALGI